MHQTICMNDHLQAFVGWQPEFVMCARLGMYLHVCTWVRRLRAPASYEHHFVLCVFDCMKWHAYAWMRRLQAPASYEHHLPCACLIVWNDMRMHGWGACKLQQATNTICLVRMYNCMYDMCVHGWGACGYEYALCVIARMASICMGNASGRNCMLWNMPSHLACVVCVCVCMQNQGLWEHADVVMHPWND